MSSRPYIGLVLCLIALMVSDEGNGRDLPFGRTVGMAGVKIGEKVRAGKLFGFTICVETFKTTLENIEMRLSIPPEVELTNGETSWKGRLDQNQEHCLFPSMKSKTDMDQWTKPIHGHTEFAEMSEGLSYTWDVKWSQSGLEDTDFVPKTGRRDEP